jgi:hypothetical protein
VARGGFRREGEGPGGARGAGEVRPQEVAREHRHHRARRPREDDADGRADDGAGDRGRQRGEAVRLDRSGAGGVRVRDHHQQGGAWWRGSWRAAAEDAPKLRVEVAEGVVEVAEGVYEALPARDLED